MATIKQRLQDLLTNHLEVERWRHRPRFYGVGVEIPNDAAATAFDTACDLEAAIIADWNAAVEAMKMLIRATITQDNTGWYCSKCRGSQEFHPERHTPEKCPVAAAQVVIALMDGNSHSRDEAMVEDKRYERDDIYKK